MLVLHAHASHGTIAAIYIWHEMHGLRTSTQGAQAVLATCHGRGPGRRLPPGIARMPIITDVFYCGSDANKTTPSVFTAHACQASRFHDVQSCGYNTEKH